MCKGNHAGPYCQACLDFFVLEFDGTCRAMTAEEIAALEAVIAVQEEEAEEESGR